MFSCNLTPPQLNRSISLLIIARVCIHTFLCKAFSHSLSKTSWLMEPILIIVNIYLTTVISTLLFRITMFLILGLFRHDRWTLAENDESLRHEWPVTQLLSLVFPNDQEQLFPLDCLDRLAQACANPSSNRVVTVGIKGTLRVSQLKYLSQ